MGGDGSTGVAGPPKRRWRMSRRRSKVSVFFDVTNNSAIRHITGKPPVGWYYGMVQSKAGVRSRALVAKTFEEEGLPLKYYSDDYSDDLPHWIESPHAKGEGLLVVPYA